MHWLSILGIVLVAAGTFCTYWGVEMRSRNGASEGAPQAEVSHDLDELREEQKVLVEQTKLVQQENERLRANNATLALKHKQVEEDVEIYKSRAAQLQQSLDERKAQEVTTQQQTAEETPSWGDMPPTGKQPLRAAEQSVQQPLEEDTESEMEVIGRLQALLNARNYAGLEQEASDQVDKNPDWMTPYVYLGVASRQLGRKEKALQSFVYVLENGAGDPAYPQAERALKLMTTGIQELAEKNDWAELAGACDAQIGKEPDWYLPYYFGGLAYTHVGDKEKAMEYLQIFIENSEGDPEIGKAERALRLLQTNILDLQKQGDYPALIRTCEHEIQNDSSWLTPHYLLGLAYARLGNVTKAKEHLEEFTRRAADDPDYDNAQRLLQSLN